MNHIQIVKVNIMIVHADAIVNATNEALLEGPGVSTAIFSAAGREELTRACGSIGRCETGSAVITPAFHLDANYIVHAVGPMWNSGNDDIKLLKKTYISCLTIAKEHDCHSIAFPLIAAGIHGFPKEIAWQCGISACKEMLKQFDQDGYDLEVIFVTRDDDNRKLGERVLNSMIIDNEKTQNAVKAGIFGVVVGDALGVPVEFSSRAERQADPVTDMREYGTHSQPKGTWSDDSSMMLATADSMIKCGRIDYADIMEKFQGWRLYGEYTPFGNVFDIGISCAKAISMYRPGMDPLKCGGIGDRDNGNGSLMRIMPVSLLFATREDYWEPDVFIGAAKVVQNVSALTHAHPRSMIACVLYTSICHEMVFLNGRTVSDAIQNAITKTLEFYEDNPERFAGMNRDFPAEIRCGTYDRLRDISDFATIPDAFIKSSGYVVHTLEAAIWCLLNSSSYKECVLKVVNLGEDTDTVGAAAGGLAGLLYGFDGIPSDWLDVIVAKDKIDAYCNDLAIMILGVSREK